MTEQSQRSARAVSFGAGAAIYERARPTYPDAAVDWLVPPNARRVVDLGAGTGKLTRALVARGLEVTAVEPSAGMLEQLREAVPGAAALPGSAEAIPLGDASVDLVVSAQAWHWFDPVRAAAEAARVLRPGGTLAQIWNTRDTTVAWVTRFGAIADRGHPHEGYVGPPALAAPFAPVEHWTRDWALPLDLAALRDLTASRSAYLAMDEAARRATLAEIDALFHAVAAPAGGDPGRRVLAMPYVTRCFRARRR